jgi:hypothetical protein
MIRNEEKAGLLDEQRDLTFTELLHSLFEEVRMNGSPEGSLRCLFFLPALQRPIGDLLAVGR